MPPRRASSSLPAEVTSFVGRRRELAEIRSLLGTTRLLTLTGTGGAGKSRLALRAAAELGRAYEDVVLAELAPLSDPAAVVETVARALGMRDQSGRWPVGTLVDYVGARRLLLVLDNTDHLVEASAVLVDALLRGCPQVQVLATSRQLLGIDGETAMRVPSLPVPDITAAVTPETLVQYDAVRLFVDRASARQPGYAISEAEAGAVAQLCRRLDGIPLAIELAAGRLDVLSVTEILGRLDDRLRILGGGSRSALPRHRTLRAAIEWSAGLLEVTEQVLWRRASVFPGDFDVETAETVCAGDVLPATGVLEALSGLVAKSILTREAGAGHARFRLLETLRAYGQERLAEAGEVDVMRERLSAWVEDLAGRFSAAWWGPSQAEWLDRLAAEEPSIRAALGACVASGDGERGLRMVAAIWQYGETRGYLRDTRRLLDAFLDTYTEPTPLRARGLWLAGYFARNESDRRRAAAFLDECLRLSTSIGDTADLGCARLYSAILTLDEGHTRESARLLREAIDTLRSVDEPHHLGFACHCLASTLRYLGRPDDAAAAEREAMALSEAAGESWLRAHILNTQGLLAFDAGDGAAADAMLRESVRLRRRLDHRWGLLLVLETMIWTTAAADDALRAATLTGIVDAIAASLQTAPPGHVRIEHERAVERMTAALGGPEVERLRRQGASMSLSAALAYALDEAAPARSRPGVDEPQHEGLTRREREIAGLVAEGLSNRAIAQRLFISERTADTHVQNVLGKLGFQSRAQIAAWVAQRRATGGAVLTGPKDT